jgi:hypothetical protein
MMPSLQISFSLSEALESAPGITRYRGRLTFLKANLRFYPIKRKERKSRIISRTNIASVLGVAVELLLRATQGYRAGNGGGASPERCCGRSELWKKRRKTLIQAAIHLKDLDHAGRNSQ